jgi:hypothetical protein
MNKLLALAAAGVIAISATAMTAAPSFAAPGGGNWQGQNQQWKKFQGGQNWQGPKNFQGGPKNFGNVQGPKKFSNYQGPKKFNGNWNGPKKNWNNNWNGQKPPFHGNYPKKKWPKYAKWQKWQKHHHHHNNFVGPFVFGLALGAIANNAYANDYAGLSPHQLWCLRAYPNTYNPATNLFYVRPGVPAVCVSPYSSGPIGYFPY